MILLALVVLGTEPMPPRTADCRADGDCMITTFRGCCTGDCCPPAPFATSRSNYKAQQDRCAIMDCGAPRCSGSCVKQEPVTAFRAVCQSGQCTAVRATGRGECATDSECRVDWVKEGACTQSPCGCCEGTPIAVHVSKPQPAPPPQPRPLTKKDQKAPPFGLNQGGQGPPPPNPPACSPCPAPPVVRAACSTGRCVLLRERD